MSADKSGMHRNTARKYVKSGGLPSQEKTPHTWRTREDPFADVWEEVEELLGAMPELQAVTIFDYLQEQYPGCFSDGQLRTLQRRVKQYRLAHGLEREVFFAQVHAPGEEVAIDWMDGGSLQITIGGEPFAHKLFHAVLVYSNWEWATICASESFLSLKEGLQESLFRLGGVPQVVLSDNSSAATHRIEKDRAKRTFNTDYAQLLAHLKLRGRTINLGCPQENGDVESMHGHLRRRLRQALLLRGSHDFVTREDYQAFLAEQVERANANRTARVAEELACLRELPAERLPSYEDSVQTVGSGATVRARKTTYSVPSRLIGQKVVVRLHEDVLEVLCGREVMYRTGRAERGGEPIDYRHVIGSLVKKPGAFRHYQHREALFPSALFRNVYDCLGEQLADAAAQDKTYLRILKLAADQGEERVGEVLERLLASGEPFSDQAVREAVGECHEAPPIKPFTPVLTTYMALLAAGGAS